MRIVGTLRKAVVVLWLPVVLIAAWDFGSRSSTSMYFPSLSRILQRFHDNWIFARFGEDVVPTLEIFALGYLAAVILGIAVGTLLGYNPWLARVVDPFAQFLRALPAVALIPLVLILAGTGIEGKIILVVTGAIWPVLLNTVDGIRAMEPELRRTAGAYLLPRRVYLFSVVLPAAAVNIIAGARIGLAIAMVLTIGSEMFAATEGIGYFVLQAQQSFMITDMWSGIILLGILGYLLTQIFTIVERKILRWNH